MSLTEALQDIITFFFQLFVVFPYSALTIDRQLPLQRNGDESKEEGKKAMLSKQLVERSREPVSISSLLAEYPSLSPEEAYKKVFDNVLKDTTTNNFRRRISNICDYTATFEELARTARCGKWGDSKPSELFLKISHDALGPVDRDNEKGMVSPSLMGSSGVMPLTILST